MTDSYGKRKWAGPPHREKKQDRVEVKKSVSAKRRTFLLVEVVTVHTVERVYHKCVSVAAREQKKRDIVKKREATEKMMRYYRGRSESDTYQRKVTREFEEGEMTEIGNDT